MMIAVENQNVGTYPIFLDGGNTVAISTASTWGPSNVLMNYINELGTAIRALEWASNTSTIGFTELPAGNYEIVIPSTATNVTITLNRAP